MGSLGREPDLHVRSVAVGLVRGVTAATESGFVDPVDGASRAGAQLEVALDLIRAVRQRRDLQRPAAIRERLARLGLGFTRGLERQRVVAAVTKRLVLRGAAAAQRGAEADVPTAELA